MSMHVLQLGPYPPPEGGVSRNMLAIRDQLLKRGDRCSIIATSRSNAIENEPDVYHPNSPTQIIKLLTTLKYDLVHLHVGGELNNRVLGLALIVSLFARKKGVLTVHSGAFPLTGEAKNAKRSARHGIVFRRFGGIIAVNTALRDVFLRFGVEDDRIYSILPFALQSPDQQVDIPKDLDDFCDRHSPLLLSVGGLEKDYDPLFQVAAMNEIVKDFPNAGLMLVGDGSMRNEVEEAVLRSDSPDKIMVAGNVKHAVTLHLIDKADILLRTTLFDGDAISVREALFLGTPVIATDNGMRPEGAHLIEIGDIQDLTSQIRTIVSTPTARSSKVADGSDNIGFVIKLYERLIAT